MRGWREDEAYRTHQRSIDVYRKKKAFKLLREWISDFPD